MALKKKLRIFSVIGLFAIALVISGFYIGAFDYLPFPEQDSSPDAISDFGILFVRSSDNHLAYINENGTETDLIANSGSGVTKNIQLTIATPKDLDESDTLPLWSNESGTTFTITSIKACSDKDNVDFVLKYAAPTNFTASTTLATMTISTNGTGVYYTSVSGATEIPNTNIILFDNDAADDPDYIKITILGWFASE